MMDSFIIKDGKKLRRGFTTGSCAAAAAKAAAIMLLGGETLDSVWLMTPRGIGLTLDVKETERGDGFVSCGIVKDAGDDPDVTNGLTVYARVEKTGVPRGVTIDGGEGVGRVTKPGLDQPVGNAAINSTPRRMIGEALREVMEDYGYAGGLSVVISAPDGAQIAKKTFNPRLGFVG
ncbi:MAG: cobalt-precorrin-5B (C(1))-methyltransferase, partial [Clostridia bacterium]|nr:cobalt-precorrin-5B (C(1))-methyltransferase [Clostridia bacterium]